MSGSRSTGRRVSEMPPIRMMIALIIVIMTGRSIAKRGMLMLGSSTLDASTDDYSLPSVTRPAPGPARTAGRRRSCAGGDRLRRGRRASLASASAAGRAALATRPALSGARQQNPVAVAQRRGAGRHDRARLRRDPTRPRPGSGRSCPICDRLELGDLALAVFEGRKTPVLPPTFDDARWSARRACSRAARR